MPKKLLRRIFIKWARACRPMNKHDILSLRLKICRLNDLRPSDVKNFWAGIEELKGSICDNCGAYLSQKTRKIAKGLGADYVLCKKCNPKPKS